MCVLISELLDIMSTDWINIYILSCHNSQPVKYSLNNLNCMKNYLRSAPKNYIGNRSQYSDWRLLIMTSRQCKDQCKTLHFMMSLSIKLSNIVIWLGTYVLTFLNKNRIITTVILHLIRYLIMSKFELFTYIFDFRTNCLRGIILF